jgi:TolB-like protein
VRCYFEDAVPDNDPNQRNPSRPGDLGAGMAPTAPSVRVSPNPNEHYVGTPQTLPAAAEGPPRGEPIAPFDPSRHPSRIKPMVPWLAGGTALFIITMGFTMLAGHHSGGHDGKPDDHGQTPDTSPNKNPVATPDPSRHQGPLRLSVLPFKNVSGNEKLDFLKDALQESVLTDLGPMKDVKMIERGQIDLDLKELDFEQTKYVDPTTRAVIGKINGAEVVVLGGFQRVGGTVRVSTRLVDAETGEVLETFKVERTDDQVLELQDQVAEQLKDSVEAVKKRLRP